MLDSTVGGPDANSYVSEDDASSYFETMLNAQSWLDARAPTRESALITASRLLDENVNWYGSIASDLQSLRWPRSGVYDQDSREFLTSTIPAGLKNITCDLALYLIENGGYTESTTQFTAINLGPLGLKYKDGSTFGFPKQVIEALKLFGIYEGPLSGRQASNIKLVRT